MSDCCCAKSEPASSNTTECPVSGTKGVTVELQTVKAVLTNAALRRVTAAAHRFCADPECDIVYFADDGTTSSKTDIRVPVWQKEPAGARMVCYCFGENERDIRAEIAINGKSDALERVKAHIKARRCACELRNPRGTCCLGDVGAAVKRVSESFAQPTAVSGHGHGRFGTAYDVPDRGASCE
jgi:hypothetical protein